MAKEAGALNLECRSVAMKETLPIDQKQIKITSSSQVLNLLNRRPLHHRFCNLGRTSQLFSEISSSSQVRTRLLQE